MSDQNTNPDPALTANTFVRNSKLTEALERIKAQRAAYEQRVNTGAETPTGTSDATDPQIPEPIADRVPTEREINEMYLVACGWAPITLDGINKAWESPDTGAAMPFESALFIQEYRDEMKRRAALPALEYLADSSLGYIRTLTIAAVTVEFLQVNVYFNPHDVRTMFQVGANVVVELFK